MSCGGYCVQGLDKHAIPGEEHPYETFVLHLCMLMKEKNAVVEKRREYVLRDRDAAIGTAIQTATVTIRFKCDRRRHLGRICIQ